MSFTYNDEGIRTSKTVNGVTTHYYLNGSQILAEETNGNITLYVYDVAGSPIGYQYHGANYAADAWDIYWYEKNLQGDIIAVYNQAGTKLVYYRYTAYGEFSAHSAITGVDAATFRNPFTYRGYYYDYDLGMYYLNSRYYDANTCRFINADTIMSGANGSLKGFNLYAYCFNNPIMLTDDSGNWPEWMKSTVKWVAEKIFKPVVDTLESIVSEIDFTYSNGVSSSASLGLFAVSTQLGLSIDAKGNVAIQTSISGGISTSPGVSLTTYRSVSNAPSIYKLEGIGYQAGTAIGKLVGKVPLTWGGDINFIPDSENDKTYYGTTGNFGIGEPGFEVHALWGKTYTDKHLQFNIFEAAKNVYDRIKEW